MGYKCSIWSTITGTAEGGSLVAMVGNRFGIESCSLGIFEHLTDILVKVLICGSLVFPLQRMP